jgi:hypothetical protein
MAAIDVTDPEPPETSRPLLTMDKVIITAHSAFFSPVSELERWQRPADEVGRLMSSEWPRDLVNPQAKGNYLLKWGSIKETSVVNRGQSPWGKRLHLSKGMNIVPADGKQL